MSTRRQIIAFMTMGTCLAMASSAARADDYVDNAKAYIAKITAVGAPWVGPTTGPKAQGHKLVVMVNQDQRNSGGRGVMEAAAEAAKILGWDTRFLDGQGTIAGQTEAVNQAIALKPDGIALINVDAREHNPEISQAAAMGIKLVSWHAGPVAGKLPDSPIFTNVSTDPAEVARATGLYAVADSNGAANVIILVDSAYQIGVTKTAAAKAAIEGCKGCSLLSIYDSPFAEISSRMAGFVRNMKAKYGEKWTYTIATNDLYYDFIAPELRAEGVSAEGPPKNISEGDGSESAFRRIEKNDYQVGVIAEAMRVDGFQVMDELNRAFADQPPSGFVAPFKLVTPANATSERAEGKNGIYFDPSNGYEQIYRKIWGK
jgi:ribose transport system substrate-binding protein